MPPRLVPRALGLLLLLLVLPARDARALTWRDAVERARAHAPTLAPAQARVEDARRGVGVAAMVPNPTLQVGSYLESARLYTAVSVPLPVWGQLGLAADAARARVDEARAQQQGAQLDAGVAALLAWLDLWSARAQLRAAEELAARLERTQEAVRALVSAQLRPALDAATARAEWSAAQAEVGALRYSVAAAQALLNARLGQPLDGPADLEGDPPSLAPPPLAAALEASGQHPSLSAARARVRAATEDVRTEERLRIPTPSLQVGAYLLRVSAPPADVYVGLSVELPVFNQRTPLVERARAREGLARAEQQALEVQLAAELRAAWEALRAASERADAQTREVLPASRAAAEGAEEAYRAGRLDLQAWLAAEQRLALARQRADLAAADRGRAYAAVLRALGASR